MVSKTCYFLFGLSTVNYVLYCMLPEGTVHLYVQLVLRSDKRCTITRKRSLGETVLWNQTCHLPSSLFIHRRCRSSFSLDHIFAFFHFPEILGPNLKQIVNPKRQVLHTNPDEQPLSDNSGLWFFAVFSRASQRTFDAF